MVPGRLPPRAEFGVKVPLPARRPGVGGLARGSDFGALGLANSALAVLHGAASRRKTLRIAGDSAVLVPILEKLFACRPAP